MFTNSVNITNRQEHYGSRILAKDITVSNDTWQTLKNNNDVIVGSSGSSKTLGYCLPNILMNTGSMVVTDTKGNLYKKTKDSLEAKGIKTQVLDLVNPNESCGYNPLDYIRRYPDGSVREQDVLTVTNAICPTLDNYEAIWDQCAASQVAFYISYCLEALPKSDHNMLTVAELHRAFIKPNGYLGFAKWLNEHKDSFAYKKYSEIRAMGAADRMSASVNGFINQYLAPFDYKEAKHIFAKRKSQNFDIRSLGTKPTVLFVNVSDTDRTYDRIYSMFMSQALSVLCQEADLNESGHLDVPTRFIFDDFTAYNNAIVDFDKIISIVRSRDISISIILQSIQQLETAYGEAKSNVILDSCDTMLYLGTSNIRSAEYIGTKAFKSADVILTMPNDKAYLCVKGQKAQLVEKNLPNSSSNETECHSL